MSGTCTKAVLDPWAGVSCSGVEDITPKIYFHVPRATDPVATSADFYKLPFPNDIRIQNGKVSLARHPRPGPRILPFDLVDRYITAIEAESTGFSANPTIFLRLSKQFNASAFPGDCGVSLVDITPTSPNYARAEGLACGANNGSSRYVCGPYMWARTRLGHPLRPGAIDNFGLDPVDPLPPVSYNAFFGSYGKLTALEIQYQPGATYDGHLVSTQNAGARAAIQEMLVTTARDGIPTVSP